MKFLKNANHEISKDLQQWQVALLDTPPTDGLAWATYESLLSRVEHETSQGYRQLTQKEQPWQIDS